MKLQEIYQDAITRNYSIGAFNFYNLESMKGILNSSNMFFAVFPPVATTNFWQE